VGLATDIELLDVFPNSYIAWWSRQHRWIRGDWQIIDWLKSCVPVGGGRMEPIRFSAFNRWKIFEQSAPESGATSDHCPPPSRWFFTPAPILWSAIIAGLMLWPVLNAFPRPIVPSAARPERDFGATRATGSCASCSRLFFWRIIRPWRSMPLFASSTGESRRIGYSWNGRRRQTLNRRREKSANCNLFSAGFGSPLPAYSCSSVRRREEPVAMVAAAPFLLLGALFPWR